MSDLPAMEIARRSADRLSNPVRRGREAVRLLSASRWARPLALGLTLLFVAYGVFVLWTIFQTNGVPPGSDREIYADAARRWLTGSFVYYPEQLAGPYELAVGHVLYPPITLPIFAVLGGLAAPLWWIVPISVVLGVIAWHRPAYWAWPVIAACLGFQWSVMLLYAGNPTLWLAAAVALGSVRGWPSALVLLKPTLFPFALIGLGRRGWWATIACLAVTSVPFGSLWIDWVHAVLYAHGWRVGVLYSLGDVPWLLAPVIAWVAATRRGAARPGPRSSRGAAAATRVCSPPPSDYESATPLRSGRLRRSSGG